MKYLSYIAPMLVAVGLIALASLVPPHKANAASGSIFLICSKTFDPPSIAAAGSTTTTATCPGVALGDYVDTSFSLSQASVGIAGYVSAANTVTFLLTNNTAGAIDLASGTISAKITPRYVSP